MRALFLVISCGLLLTACIPAIKTVYHTPSVSGTVIDQATRQPLAGVVVSHLDYKRPQVITDENGHFNLPSVSSINAVLIMAAHALKPYPVKFAIADQSTVVEVIATMKMYHEEHVAIPVPVVIDTSMVPSEK